MKIIYEEDKLCLNCMEVHSVKHVEIEDSSTFKGELIHYLAIYEYCDNTSSYSENNEQIKINSLALKDQYRIKMGLLPSYEIKRIREKYAISQKEFSEVLGWGAITIIRYENSQVQDRAHDDILRKIDSDPAWFIDMLNRSKEKINPKLFINYFKRATEELTKKINPYTFDKLIYASNLSNNKLTSALTINSNFKSNSLIYTTQNFDIGYNVKKQQSNQNFALAA